MKILIFLILLISQSFAADRAEIEAINAQLATYHVKHLLPAGTHDRIVVFVRPQNLPGYIHASTFPITRVTANEIRFNIPNGLDLRECSVAPNVERILIKDETTDSLVVNMIEEKPIQISCTSQNLSKYFFISYKN